MTQFELNLDGLVGPTHHYAGLAFGNIASKNNAKTIANPAAAARQGIEKMRLMYQLGIKQGVIPPQLRPNLALLHQLGFTGIPAEQLQKAYDTDSMLLSACYSASSMWTANLATVAPSVDTVDQRVHFTPANLVTNIHRAQESQASSQILQRIFANPAYFRHHSPLPATPMLGDEGAANHSRLCKTHANPGVHLFVYGKDKTRLQEPKQFPARQTLEASQAVARLNQLPSERVFFARQNPAAIDAGVFHNDVIAVANESVLLLHEDAYLDQSAVLTVLKKAIDFPLTLVEIDRKRITLEEAVASYLFNAQLVTLPDQTMALIVPIECEEHSVIKAYIDEIIEDNHNPISHAHYLNLRQSMRNGGGPACLRFRVPLSAQELSAMHQGVLVNERLLNELDLWVNKYYRDRLSVDDLRDPALIDETQEALQALELILGMPVCL